MRSRLSRAAVVLILGLGGGALAGCGSSAGNLVDPVARAAVISNQAPGLRLNMTARISSSSLPAPVLMDGQGSVQVASHRGSLTFTMHLPNLPQVTQALGSSTLTLDERFDGTTIYMKLPPALSKRAPGGKPWLKLDLAKAASSAGLPGLGSLANNPASSDPSQMLGYLRATSGGVRKVGTETVNGLATTHYRGRLELDRVPGRFPPASRAQVRRAIAALEQLAHLKTLPVDVWVDRHQLVRRMHFAIQASVSGQSLQEAFTIDIPQYGPQPAPTLPRASQVSDVTSLSSGSGSSP